MKNITAVLVAVMLAVAAPASAQKVDLSTITCKDFLASGKENVGLILMWLTGYYADQEAPPVIDFDKMRSDAAKIGEYCAANPGNGLITAAEEVFE
jgi:acid stress chaperone HdeB